ncbi:Leucine-rich repeat-containing protein let-4 [Caenorhabditis elegans]|uniref:Leucine-rich repeat-containing protein let-4 n=1 Tax=Caenorhabditis elegans TaxID=6239 RepID=LET4_CAEEL|nr:Leucine-rich repeat-containing protein let-4 [Caenorhabditis elegans]Q93373.2 RecName: Full=Leucine-rich repeat-containing protein let-4; AltName: Full=Lethal protein 4; Flags: Precursor [Caenorhabditis elegans]AEZ55699.1 LET-4 [Caenorhabditis elegans]CAB01864.2 Leucine-rich repeat-containing protein let-4 [Caenorhabditis elegans]|eukprot:NP_510425.2 Leucine-rich repeat-containing protein let-4 [Caenorhabditis elegans]
MRLLLCLLLFSTLLINSTNACPGVITQACFCSEVHSGIVLDCSNSSASGILQIIRTNQAQVGLIQSLTMNQAELVELPPNFFSGLFIRRLDLSQNKIKKIDDAAFAGINPVLEEVVLNHNLIEKVPAAALAGLPNLLRLDLSNNSIVEIQEQEIFPNLNKLYDINLGSNKIFSIHTSTFQNVKNSIQTINLGHNNMTAVPSSAIRGLKQLQSLHLHKNRIEQLDALNFLNLPVLNLLNLAGNQIHELNRQAFLNVPSLRYLYLSGNKITKLTAYQFQTFEQLEMLDLTNNEIGAIPANSLSGLKQLRQLYLAHNKISNISSNAFTNSSIVVLVLSSNELKTLTAGIISGLPNLQQVSFRDNQIKTINRNAFYDAASLVMLDLAKNQLTEIAPTTFLAQLNLLLVDLSENKLPKTPYSAFNSRVGTVLLKENPLVCTENLHMLQQGTGVYVRDSPDIICGRKPTPKPEPVLVPIVTDSLISTQRPALVQIPKMQIHRNVHTTTGDQAPQIPSGAFQQIDLGKSRSLPRGHSRFILDKPSTREQSVEPTEELTPIQPIILPSREDEIRQSSMEAGTSQESVEATSQKIPSTTDIIDRPNVVLPFPVPFLKRGPNLSESKKVESTDMPSTSQVFHTLPPSILIEPGSTPKVAQPSTEANIKSEHIDEFALASSNSNEPTLQPRLEKSFFTTTIIFICVGTAVIVLVVVIAGLCISKHRQLQFENTYSDSSAARTSEYISTQYRQNSLRGTGGRVGRFEESPAWIYNPGSSYCNYYK